MGLCQFYGVPVAPNKVIRPPINRAFIKKYYAPRQAQGGHNESLGTTSSWRQMHHHHLQNPPQLIYKGWNIAYDTWPTIGRPITQAGMSKY